MVLKARMKLSMKESEFFLKKSLLAQKWPRRRVFKALKNLVIDIFLHAISFNIFSLNPIISGKNMLPEMG